MRIRLFTIAVLLYFSLPATAQISSEIRNYVDTTEVLINNGRRLLGQSLIDGNLAKVAEVYNYLVEHTSESRYTAFTFSEHLYINMILGDWTRWGDIASGIRTFREKLVYPGMYNLNDLLQSEATGIAAENTGHEAFPGVDEETAGIAGIYTHLIGSEYNEEYNRLLKEFRERYPESRYSEFIDTYMPGPFMKGSWTWTIGSSYLIPTSDYGESYAPAPLFFMSMDFNIGRVFTSLYISAGSQKLLTPFTATTPYETFNFTKGERFSCIGGGIAAGYFIGRGDRINMAPYLSIGGGTLESDRFNYDTEEKEIRVYNSFMAGGGLHTEIKIVEFTTPNPYGYTNLVNSYLSLKLEAGYDAITSFKIPEFKGNIIYLRAGLVWGLGDF